MSFQLLVFQQSLKHEALVFWPTPMPAEGHIDLISDWDKQPHNLWGFWIRFRRLTLTIFVHSLFNKAFAVFLFCDVCYDNVHIDCTFLHCTIRHLLQQILPSRNNYQPCPSLCILIRHMLHVQDPAMVATYVHPKLLPSLAKLIPPVAITTGESTW